VRNLTENIAAVQFDHRLLATLTALAAIATLVVGFAVRSPRATRFALAAFLGAALVQYLIGVATLLLVVPIALATLHQAVAALLLTAAIVLLHTSRPSPAGRR
jgi:cytochrome c oxidase assembly protein subunit 15